MPWTLGGKENGRETHAERVQVGRALQGAFGGDGVGCRAEVFARFFGTPRVLIGQTFLVGAWIVVNVVAVALRWDPYPFILLNLALSLQAAYATRLILLAQTRQTDRDKANSALDIKHREARSGVHATLGVGLAAKPRFERVARTQHPVDETDRSSDR